MASVSIVIKWMEGCTSEESSGDPRPGAFVFKGPAFGDELGLGWRWMGVPLEIDVFWDPACEDAAGGEWRVWYGGETYWRSTAEFLVRCIGRVWSMRTGNMPKKISSTPSSRGGTPYHSTSSGHRPFTGGSGSEASLYAPCVVPANDECQAMAL
jgi:hypothetical protein